MKSKKLSKKQKLILKRKLLNKKKKNIRYNHIDWCLGTCNKNTYVSSKGYCRECTEAGEFGA